ncbi:cytochrome P450 94A1-like [Pistacia vera]|uniref:cytochrome P450 94A1-like n=1 Tax=Pistacia vera TaxID=55513 RepID=UPI0012632935|nr:cytochrome P450 94A1-like [Pistacia vera]
MFELDSSSLTFLPCFTFFISLFFFFYFYFYFSYSPCHPKTKTPSPQSYPIIGNLPGFLRNHRRFHDWVTELLSQTTSSTIQVNSFLNLSHGICTADPINIQHLLLSNFSNYIKGSRYHSVLHELLRHGIFSVDGHLWTLQRKIASHEFNTRSLKHFISEVVKSEISKSFIPFLSDASDRNIVFDLQELLQDFTFKNICNVAFGVDSSCKQNSSEFMKAFDDAVEICSSRFTNPVPAIWKTKRFLNIGSEKRFKEAIKVINDYAMEILKSKEKEEEETTNFDLLSRFMAASSSMEMEEEEKRKFLRDIVISFILAGKDSTSTALTWFFWLIAGHPRCGSLIREELSSLPASELRPRIFSYDELKKLHYLHAALSESMRLFPPVPINSRLTVDDDVLPDGTHVRKGWFADYSAYAVGRMEKAWGRNYMEFKPERWLNGDGVFQPSDQFRFPVFHCGPRMCLGKEMAYVQMKSIAAAVMNEFEILAIDGGGTAGRIMDPPYTLSLVLKMRGGLPVQIRRR